MFSHDPTRLALEALRLAQSLCAHLVHSGQSGAFRRLDASRSSHSVLLDQPIEVGALEARFT